MLCSYILNVLGDPIGGDHVIPWVKLPNMAISEMHM